MTDGIGGEFDFNNVQPEAVLGAEQEYDPLGWMSPAAEKGLDVDPGFMRKTPRKPNAVAYEKKMGSLITDAISGLAQSPALLPDAAALIMTGESVSIAVGDLAAADDRAAHVVDWLSGGVSNPYLAFGTAVAPLLMQFVRNHEPILEPKQRKIGFRKFSFKIPFKFGIRLGILRHQTANPERLAVSVFTDERVMKRLNELEIPVAFTPRNGR